MRRFLFYIFGNAAFDPQFDIALTYHDAIAHARREPTCVHRPWEPNDRFTPLKQVEDWIHQRVLEAGPTYLISLGQTLSKIRDRASHPEMQERLHINATFLIFDASRLRHPTLKELRFWSWYRKTENGKKKLNGFFDPSVLPKKLLSDWEYQAEGWMDRAQFARTVREMRQPLFPSRLLDRLHRVYIQIGQELKRPPNPVEYIKASRGIVPLERCSLSECNVNQLIEYLTSPDAPCEFSRWNGREDAAGFIEKRVQALPLSARGKSNAIALAKALATLDYHINLEDMSTVIFGVTKRIPCLGLDGELRRLAGQTKSFPGVDAFLRLSDSSVLRDILKEIGLLDLEVSRFIHLQMALKTDPFKGHLRLAELQHSSDDLRVLVSALSPAYETRVELCAYAEFTDNAFAKVSDIYSHF